jgi:hypothetical protein
LINFATIVKKYDINSQKTIASFLYKASKFIYHFLILQFLYLAFVQVYSEVMVNFVQNLDILSLVQKGPPPHTHLQDTTMLNAMQQRWSPEICYILYLATWFNLKVVSYFFSNRTIEGQRKTCDYFVVLLRERIMNVPFRRAMFPLGKPLI